MNGDVHVRFCEKPGLKCPGLLDDRHPIDSATKLTQRLNIDFALQAAGLGIWEYDPVSNQVLWDERCRTLFGLSTDNPMSYEQVFEHIHPDDITRVDQAARWVMNPQSNGVFDQIYRTIGVNDGQLRWVHFQGRVDFTPAGEVQRFAGVAQEVTSQMQDKQQLLDQQAQLRSIVQQTPAPILVLRGEDYIIDQINPPMLAFMGRGEDVVGQPFLAVMPELLGQFAWQQVQRVYQQGVDFDESEVRVTHVRNGVLQDHYYNVSYRPLREAGKIVGMIQVAIDVTGQVKTQQALQQSEARFQNLVRQANVGLIVLQGEEFRVTVVNEAYSQLVDHRVEELLGQPIFAVLPGVENDFRPLLEQVMATGSPVAMTEARYQVQSASGQTIEGFTDTIYQPYREADGRVTGVMAMVSNITQLVYSRQTIAQNEAKLRALIEEAPVATCLFVGRELRIELANPMMLNVWGKDQSVLGRPLVEAVPELKGQPFLAILDEVFTSGQVYRSRDARAELEVDGVLGTYYFDFTYKPLFNAAGEVYAIMDMAVDVTQPVKTRLELANQKAHLQTAIDIGDLGTFEINVLTQSASFSERLGRWFNLAPPTQPVAHFLANVHRDDQDMVARALDESVLDQRQSRHDVTYRIVDAQGATTHYLRSIGEAQYIDGQPRSISGMIQDVTPQVQAHRKLEESEVRFRNIVQQSPAATLVLRGDDLVIDQINQPMLDFMGRGQEVIGQPLVAAVPELDGQDILQQARRVYTEGDDFDGYEVLISHARTGVRQDYYYDLSYRPLKENGQLTGVIQVVTDVTAQVRARQQVEQSTQQLLLVNQRLNLALDAGRLGAYTLDLATGIMDVSEQCRANYGQPAETPFNFPDLIATIVDDDREPVQQAVTRAVETRTMYTAEYRIVWPDGTLHWVKASGQPEYGADGQLVRITGVTQEITAQRLMQDELERQVEQRMRQLQASVQDLRRSNENLEQFAYIASHDLQEPLRKIQQFGDLLKTRLADSIDGQEQGYLDRMQVAAGRMSVLIKDLLTFSRISTTQAIAQPVMLNEVVNEALESLSVVIAESGAQIEQDDLPMVQGEGVQLSQLFQNLLSNALKFRRTDQAGTLLTPQIRIRARQLTRDELPASIEPSRNTDQYHLIEVIDNGIGFDEKYLDRMFQVFQRLHGKNEFAGTGVGLAIVQKVVTNHGGIITAISQPGQGATFSVYLPA